MIIAVNYDNGVVFEHFGKTKSFIFYTIENNMITKKEVKDTLGKGHEDLIPFLKENGVSVLICGFAGAHALGLLKDANIEVYPGNSGDIEQLINLFLAKKLVKKDLADLTEDSCSCNCH